MLGNALFAFFIGYLHRYIPTKNGLIIGVALGSTAKFGIIAGAASYILNLPPPITGALLVPQFYNALLGGLMAVLISPFLPTIQNTSKLS
jgi:hypothetical protein